MRAIICRQWGPPETLTIEDVQPPPMIADGVRIRTHATGVNFADTLMIGGTYQRAPAFPFSPGLEAAGVVTEVAAGVSRVKPGDRVTAALLWGGFAEEAVVEESAVTVLPAAIDFDLATAFAVAYPTAHGALKWQGRLQPGEVLLVPGAAGAVGLAGIEVGKAMGATVIGACSGAEKLAVVRDHGADHVIDYSREDVRDRVLEITGGRGVDVVLDLVGDKFFDSALRCIAWGGRIVAVGFAGGRIPQIPANILLVKNVGVLGFALSTYRKNRPDWTTASIAQLFDWWQAGLLRPLIHDRLDLSCAADALAQVMARRTMGKLVLTVNPENQVS